MLPVSMVMGQSVSAGRLDDPKGDYHIKCLQPGRSLVMLPFWSQQSCSMTSSGWSAELPLSLRSCRIPIAGKISTMVFDKTGTITKVPLYFHSFMI